MAASEDPPHVASGALLLCRTVQRNGDDLSLIGVHDTRVVSRLPCRFEDLSAYLRFETLEPGKVPLEFELQPPGDERPIRLGSSIHDLGDLHVDLTVSLDRVDFREAGIHVFTFFTTNDRIVATTSLCIVLAGSPETTINVRWPGGRLPA